MKRRLLWRILLVVLAFAAVLAFALRDELAAVFGGDAVRDSWQHPDRVLAALNVQPGQRVADIGSGNGYFTFHFARAVGPEGKVYAVDIDAEANAIVEKRATELGLANIQTILAATDDPRLPEDGVDLIFLCNTYHHLEDRTEYFRRARRYLRPGGRLVIVDFRRGGSFFARVTGHATDVETLRSELEAAGYSVVSEHDFLPWQLFVIFAPAGQTLVPSLSDSLLSASDF
jgi:arsenite methyltransferase